MAVHGLCHMAVHGLCYLAVHGIPGRVEVVLPHQRHRHQALEGALSAAQVHHSHNKVTKLKDTGSRDCIHFLLKRLHKQTYKQVKTVSRTFSFS